VGTTRLTERTASTGFNGIAGESIIRNYGTAVNGALSTSKCFQVTLNMT
jgi:hypothetical protein